MGGKALAEDLTSTYSLVAQNIAEKFGLDVEQVQSVITETRVQERSAIKEERLNFLVEDGTITEDQKSLITSKMDEYQEAQDKLDETAMTMAERRTALDQLRNSLETWADDNDIPVIALMGIGPRGGRGMGGPRELGCAGPEL